MKRCPNGWAALSERLMPNPENPDKLKEQEQEQDIE